jgi:hypothetical protein
MVFLGALFVPTVLVFRLGAAEALRQAVALSRHQAKMRQEATAEMWVVSDGKKKISWLVNSG